MQKGMGFLKLASERYSVRKFSRDPVPREVISTILKAGHVAPTACNLQPQRILVIDEAESLERLKKCTRFHFDAPAALLVCCHRGECWQRKQDGKTSGEIDAGIVATHMMLEAAALGVGTTWVMSFSPEAVREEFRLPEPIDPVALLVMGYPAEDAKPFPSHSEFRPEEELVVYNRF
ncbi:MAG: nitroreductase [Provencibacterium sp.]|nr:nitroreductase [Provencibacterium sp.]